MKKEKQRPAQVQKKPGMEDELKPKPKAEAKDYKPAMKLMGKKAIITGGDSGIGRSVAIMFAKEGADVCIAYLSEDEDAEEVRKFVEDEGRTCFLFRGDLSKSENCKKLIKTVTNKWEQIDILVNNAATHTHKESIEEISDEQLHTTFATNFYSYFYLTREALKYLKRGSCIINTTSVTAYRGSSHLIDYASTKGAIVAFTRSLSGSLVDKGIRVNGVAPGPIWTPLIASTFPPEHQETFGNDVPMGRAGEPDEVATCFVFLASTDASYMTGQILHPNGGEIING